MSDEIDDLAAYRCEIELEIRNVERHVLVQMRLDGALRRLAPRLAVQHEPHSVLLMNEAKLGVDHGTEAFLLSAAHIDRVIERVVALAALRLERVQVRSWHERRRHSRARECCLVNRREAG